MEKEEKEVNINIPTDPSKRMQGMNMGQGGQKPQENQTVTIDKDEYDYLNLIRQVAILDQQKQQAIENIHILELKLQSKKPPSLIK